VREEFVFKHGWSVREQITPPLMVTVPDGQVRVVNNNYNLLQRTLPVEWRPDFKRFSRSEHYRGLIMGSRVVIFGTVTEDQQGRAITAEYVAAGSRLNLPEAITHEFGTDDINLMIGDGLLLVGGWVLLISLVQAIKAARQRRILPSGGVDSA